MIFVTFIPSETLDLRKNLLTRYNRNSPKKFSEICEHIENLLIRRYPPPPPSEKITDNKDPNNFRDYTSEKTPLRVINFYQEQHEKQTVEFVIAQRKKYEKLNTNFIGIWEGLELLNSLTDNSDPDTELSQIEHCLQTAEALRRDNHPKWMILTGLIHDLGKLLFFFGAEGQWDVVGDTFPVGCAFSPKIIFSNLFSKNPDHHNEKYNTLYGIYSPNCGLDNVLMSYGHDEDDAYRHLMNEYDYEMMEWVKLFNPYDLYSKIDCPPNVDELKPYYVQLINEFFPEKIHW
ncbi:4375_t:CDS:2 [Entrophospora sp. SA101]|nr:4375_t:CDS:2 [Entrophospora sp. SA101]CAJ0914771.1 12071_t:CDS:2 [Entrophospora sp. SA101]